MTPEAPKVRLAYIDALRGIAALAVVQLHLYHYNLVPMTGFRFSEPFHTIFDNGQLGVYIFFVISGFVIAHSLRGETITMRFIGRFALRRAVRLDIPYWSTIAAMIVLTLISNNLQSARSLPVPGIPSVLAHLVYLQQFLGYPHIVGVFWTLCYEIQFYLTLIFFTKAAQDVTRHVSNARARWLVFLPLWIVGLACATNRFPVPDALFLYCWPFFFLGVVVNWIDSGVIGANVLVPIVASMVGTRLLTESNHHYEPAAVGAAIVTALSIYIVSKAGRLESLGLGRVVQYLGKISYSLYLVHMLVGTPAMRLGIRLLGKTVNTLQALGLVITATAISILAAHVMYMIVERPATRLSKRLRLKRTAPSEVGHAVLRSGPSLP